MNIRIENHFTQFERHMDSAIANGLRDLGYEAERIAVAHAPVDTGNYRGSIGSESDQTSVAVYSPASYAINIEKGHQGVPAKPVLEDAMDEASANLATHIRRYV